MASPLVGQAVAPGHTLLHLPEDGTVKVGFGVQRIGQELRSSHAGVLRDCNGKLVVDACSRRYIPVAGDVVIGYITGKLHRYVAC